MPETPRFREDYYVGQRIKETLEDAAELGIWAEITVKGLGENAELSSQRVLPIQIDGGYLIIESEGGVAMSIEVERVKIVQLPEV